MSTSAHEELWLSILLQNKLVITGKNPTLTQVCNNPTLQRQDLESHHKGGVIIYQLAPTTSGADDNSHIKEIYDDTIINIYYDINIITDFLSQKYRSLMTKKSTDI